jgi:hypothetical protein
MRKDDPGRHGRIWPEANSETTDYETVVGDIEDCHVRSLG